MFNVFVTLPDKDEWVYVSTTPTSVDLGEIVAACQVLYPNMVGFTVEKADAPD